MSDAPSIANDNSANRPRRAIPWLSIWVVLIVLVTLWFYSAHTQLPRIVRISGGPAGGRYADLAEGIAAELESRLKIRVEVLESEGSLKNLQRLKSQETDFGLYQPETQSILEGIKPLDGKPEPATFVSNLYPEVLLPFAPAARRTAGLDNTDNRTWACNGKLSGDYAITRLLLQHLGIEENDITVESVSYLGLPQRMQDESIDVAILCCGINAPILHSLLKEDTARLMQIPSVNAFARKHPSLSRDIIPAGFFQTQPPLPAADFETVTLQAQLLASSEASVRLVEEVTRIVSDARFQRRHGLTDLFSGGIKYATDRPEFHMHPGAAHVFYPEMKPLLNPDFVEGTEGLRSFVVSLIVAIWLLHRWWTQRQMRSQEHRLDRYIRDLLQLERDQMEVDGEGSENDSRILQKMLDQVTILRQEALSEFTAHELNEDRAVDCFIEMCHALSDKINAKLTRNCLMSNRFDNQS